MEALCFEGRKIMNALGGDYDGRVIAGWGAAAISGPFTLR
jgi:hypothetical protein